ncbi:hypothetical protein [Atopomonas sediminilitoris]|uniref:COG3904 family protein n=1 Tax=Atopomonas sediminilitoris TaxID=2919919 RepID=UPI001F4E98EF|nr:hypothetical protein [Atopomonas sediminilitoris]MCJ8170882.1 hypothetical protein [Atopomonas sediminilitoris]
MRVQYLFVRWRARLLLSLTLFTISLSASARVEVQAATDRSMGSVLIAKVSEDIVPGDYEALLKGLRANPGRYQRKILLLDSLGGSVAEALRMGRLLRETGFDVLVPSRGICQGSCVYLLASGRNKTVRGHVGLHRPYFPKGDSAIAQSGWGVAGSAPSRYLQEMGVSPRLWDDMQRIAPTQPKLLSQHELKGYRLN